MATKITKSELKQMIREALREELAANTDNLTENVYGGFGVNDELTKTLDKALKNSRRGKLTNVLVNGYVSSNQTTIKNWAARNGLNVQVLDARSALVRKSTAADQKLGNAYAARQNTILLVVNYAQSDKLTKSEVMSKISGGGQLFSILVLNKGLFGKGLTAKEASMFALQVNA
jgi:hypothetical protein